MSTALQRRPFTPRRQGVCSEAIRFALQCELVTRAGHVWTVGRTSFPKLVSAYAYLLEAVTLGERW